MSVSNAFGSNTFNIFIALAVPWLVGAILAGPNDNCPEHDYTYPLKAGKIFQSCVILGAVLALMVTTLVLTQMQLTKEIGVAFNILYLVIMAYIIAGSGDGE